MRKYILFFALIIFVVTLSRAEGTIGSSFPQYSCVTLYQLCSNCTFVNVSSVTLPNSTVLPLNVNMNKVGVDYTYSFCGTVLEGEYLYSVYGDKNGGILSEVLKFTVVRASQIPSFNASVSNKSLCANTTESILFSTFPYVAVNQSLSMTKIVAFNNTNSYAGNVTIDVNGSVFPFLFDNSQKKYNLALSFSQVGNYPFNIYSNNSCVTNYTALFLVRDPLTIKMCGFDQKTRNPYKNDYGYLIAEPTNSKKFYDTTLETYLIPLGFENFYKTPVIHSYYRNGCATLTIYDKGEYAVRFFDGVATFNTTFSPPTITKSYGVNAYVGKYNFQNDDSISLFFTAKDLHPYTWLFNWILVIIIILTVVIGVFVLFASPSHSGFVIVFGLIMIGGSLLLRVILFFLWQ